MEELLASRRHHQMADPRETAYKRLKELHSEAELASYAWTSSGRDIEWRQNVQSAFRRMFGSDCSQLKSFNGVSYSPWVYSAGTPDSVFHDSFMSGIKTAMGLIRSAIQEYEDYELNSGPDTQGSSGAKDPNQGRRVFVVHGHDNEMKEAVARFLERLDFQPIILHEQASGGDTIIEKFERNSDVRYAVVLLSPDDSGSQKDKSAEPQPRARQNVVLELGYFIGRLGRPRVCPLVRQPLELPSDFHGVVYVPFDGEDWKIHLVKELKHLGFTIDANKAF